MPSDTNPSAAPDTAPSTLLLVESDVLVRAPLAEYLRHCGYRVLEAQDASEARMLLTRGNASVDLVLVHAGLAGPENGFALATWLRRSWPGLPVLLTGGIADATQKAAKLCESGPLPDKPYGHELVLARIQKLLQQAGRRGE